MTRAQGIIAVLTLGLYAFALSLHGGQVRFVSVALLHLVALNLFLGLLEASLLRKGFGARKTTAIPRMIAANYAGSVISAPLVILVLNRYMRGTVENGWWHTLVAGAIVILVTWVVKFPFVGRCLRRRSLWFIRSIRASLLVHAVSSLILFVWYLIPSDFSVYTDVARNAALPSIPSREASCYYVSPEEGNVYRSSLDGKQPIAVATIGPCDSNSRLVAIKEQNPPCISLYADVRRTSGQVKRLSLNTKVCGDDVLLYPRDYAGATQPEHIVDLRQPDHRYLEFALAPPDNPSLEITRLVTSLGARQQYSLKREKIRLALQTPFFQYHISNVTVLPNDYVVFQIEDEIYLFDPSSRSLRRVGAGKSPVVLLQR